ncbi:hypothetical protein ACLB2K_048277 [Fragaria x ananassa]
MSDHLVLCVDHFTKPDSLQAPKGTETPGSSLEASSSSSSQSAEIPSCAIDIKGAGENVVSEEEEPLIQTVECRICQEEDGVSNLEVPCACSGSLKVSMLIENVFRGGAMRREISFVKFVISLTNLVILPHHLLSLKTLLLTSGNEGWTISGTPLDLRDPRLLAMAAAERHFLESEYDEYADTSANGAAFCRSAALILMALLLLRHALTLPNGDGDDDDASTFFSLFLLRAAGFLLPCYIMAWAISILQRRRQRQEAAALAATEVAFMLQAGQRRGLQFTIASGPAVTPHQEPIQ